MNYIVAKSKGKQRKKAPRYKRQKKNLSKSVVKKSKPKSRITVKTKNTKNKSRHTTAPIKQYIRRQDQSTGALEGLLNQGYDMVTFEARPAACSICKSMDGSTWTLQEFLDTTEYDAPIFSHIHVQCLDEVKIWSSDGSLPTVYVDWTGRVR